MTEKQNRVLLDEFVHPVHIEDEHASLQILERLAWAIRDASEQEHHELAATSQQEHYALGDAPQHEHYALGK